MSNWWSPAVRGARGEDLDVLQLANQDPGPAAGAPNEEEDPQNLSRFKELQLAIQESSSELLSSLIDGEQGQWLRTSGAALKAQVSSLAARHRFSRVPQSDEIDGIEMGFSKDEDGEAGESQSLVSDPSVDETESSVSSMEEDNETSSQLPIEDKGHAQRAENGHHSNGNHGRRHRSLSAAEASEVSSLAQLFDMFRTWTATAKELCETAKELCGFTGSQSEIGQKPKVKMKSLRALGLLALAVLLLAFLAARTVVRHSKHQAHHKTSKAAKQAANVQAEKTPKHKATGPQKRAEEKNVYMTQYWRSLCCGAADPVFLDVRFSNHTSMDVATPPGPTIDCRQKFPEIHASYGFPSCVALVDLSFILVANNTLSAMRLNQLQRYLAALSSFPWQRFGVSAEVIVLTWNDKRDRPPLYQQLSLSCQKGLVLRFLQVPAFVHRRLLNPKDEDSFPFIARNVAMRRAQGRRILIEDYQKLPSLQLVQRWVATAPDFRRRVYELDHDIVMGHELSENQGSMHRQDCKDGSYSEVSGRNSSTTWLHHNISWFLEPEEPCPPSTRVNMTSWMRSVMTFGTAVTKIMPQFTTTCQTVYKVMGFSEAPSGNGILEELLCRSL